MKYIPITEVLNVPDPASLVTVHWYTPPSDPVIIVSSNTSLLETITPSLLHSNMLLGPPWAMHIKISVELKLVRTTGGDVKTLSCGDTTEMYEEVLGVLPVYWLNILMAGV